VSARTQDAASASFTRLQAEAAEHAHAATDHLAVGDAGRTLEDMVKELLRPMLRQWLDDNLPAIVEAVVEREVERMGRSAHRR
jgi:cell pole-organizing protein PopZ